MVRHFKPFDHQAVNATNGERIQDGHGTIASLFTSDQHFPACHAFGVRQGFLNDEQSAECDGEHRPKQTAEHGDDQGFQPLNFTPDAHDEQGRYSKNNASSEGFSCRGHGLNGVVLENGDVLEEGPQNDH